MRVFGWGCPDLVKMEERLGDKMDRVLTEMGRMQRQLDKQHELISKYLVAAPAGLCSSPDSVSLDWLLRLGEDCAPLPPAGPVCVYPTMPYFDVGGEPHSFKTDFDATTLESGPSLASSPSVPSSSSSSSPTGVAARLALPYQQI